MLYESAHSPLAGTEEHGSMRIAVQGRRRSLSDLCRIADLGTGTQLVRERRQSESKKSLRLGLAGLRIAICPDIGSDNTGGTDGNMAALWHKL